MKLKDFYPNLTENKAQEAAQAIDRALMSVDESLSYKDFALAVARILIDEYGQHNFMPFIDVLHAELGISESLNEGMTLGDLELGVNFKKGSSLPFPNSDARKVINRQEDLEDYVAQFGADTKIVMGKIGRYEVPEFEAGREEAAAAKAAGIKKFGTSA